MFSLLFHRFAFMSSTNNDVEWVETTEEVVITDDAPPSENHLAGKIKLRVHLCNLGLGPGYLINVQIVSVAVVPDLESVKTPIQRLLDSVGQGENLEADGGFCKEDELP